ncbi:hypothetical protein Cni_G22361 [Canna indica]|uniref:SNRNP25 ubiquitin-like domain-containing protein n=1 Tax=Canna indica TaxID=4628 RepID=A0AAQ3QLK3_9LILI|nr:hypothetical protein Cni_G22361 [Canna indica]
MSGDVAPCCDELRRSFSQPADNTESMSPRLSLSHGGEVGIGVAHSRRSSFSYYRLPIDAALRLTILKLDGSSFEVQVAHTARVGELKKAIEDLFNQPSEDEDSSISWTRNNYCSNGRSHVWGHFCLCFNEYKLTDDKESLRAFEIKDGDQLHFIRHLYIENESKLSKRKWLTLDDDPEELRMSNVKEKYEVDEYDGIDTSLFLDDSIDDLEDAYKQLGPTESKFARIFRGLFFFSILKKSQRTLPNNEGYTEISQS